LDCRENLKYEQHITLPTPTRSNIFGVPLEELMGYNGEKGGIPRVVKDCIQFLRERGTFLCSFPHIIFFKSFLGMMEEGLFRRSPQSVMLRAAQEAYDRGKLYDLSCNLSANPYTKGHVVSLDTFDDPHLAAVLLKKYLRDLPEPMIPERLYAVIRLCPSPTPDSSDMSSVTYIRETLLPELPPCVYILLSHILRMFFRVIQL
jgi:Rho GTPase-activating protein 1